MGLFNIIDDFFGAPEAPNMGGINAGVQRATDYGYGAADADLAFRQGVYGQSLGRQQQLEQLAMNVANQQYGFGQSMGAFGQGQMGMYDQAFAPNELNMMADAYGSQYLGDGERAQLNELLAGNSGLDTQGRLGRLQGFQQTAEDRASNAAQQRVGGQVNQAYGMQGRMLGRYGGDMNRYAQAAAGMANQQALAQAHAGNMARDSVRAQGMAARQGVANFGRNFPNTLSQAYGLATSAGSSAVANQGANFAAGLPYAQFQTGAYGTQLGAAGLAQQGALGQGQQQLSQYNADSQRYGQGMAGLGQLGGMLAYGGLFAGSDRRLKSNIKRVGTHRLGIGIYEYNIAGRRERGVMADEVEKVLPEAVATGEDGYKMVNYSMLR